MNEKTIWMMIVWIAVCIWLYQIHNHIDKNTQQILSWQQSIEMQLADMAQQIDVECK